MDQQILASLSAPRLSTYLTARAFDPVLAKQLYLWNAEVGAAFHLPIQALEVVLRNHIVGILRHQFGAAWWENVDFIYSLNKHRRAALQKTVQRKAINIPELDEGRIISMLSFGFWVNLMDEWQPVAFANDLRWARSSIAKVCYLRNRIFHHEPIFKRDLLADYGLIMKLLYQLCPATHNWIRPHCRVPALVRQKP
jgi:hypothetical protein